MEEGLTTGPSWKKKHSLSERNPPVAKKYRAKELGGRLPGKGNNNNRKRDTQKRKDRTLRSAEQNRTTRKKGCVKDLSKYPKKEYAIKRIAGRRLPPPPTPPHPTQKKK